MTRHRLFNSIVLAVTLLLAACTQDELTDRTGTALSDPIPLELTAGMGEAVVTPATRGTYDGDWNGVTSVKVKVFNQEMEYAVTAYSDNETASLFPAKPLSMSDLDYWWTATSERKSFRAWTPSAYALDTEFELPATWGKDDFTTYDILGAGKIITFEERNDPVAFSHLLAKVVIHIKPSDYLETYSNSVSVQMCDLYNTGKLVDVTNNLESAGLKITAAGDKTTVTPYQTLSFGTTTRATYEALVIPQTIDSGSKLKITVGSATTYEWNIDITEFAGGYEYTFDITVKEKGLEVSARSSINWDIGGSGSGNVTLPIEIDLSKATDTITIDDNKAYLLTGSGSKPVTISGDATVILQGVSLTTTSGNAISIIGGGNPTIYVKGTNNSVTGNNAGIYVAENSTITITGDSRDDILTAKGNNGGCGIGGYEQDKSPWTSYNCGNISITNVTVYAHGSRNDVGSYAPGIGSVGRATCSTITIDNATIHAYVYNDDYGSWAAPGIGCGAYFTDGVVYSIPVVIIRNQSEVHAHRGAGDALSTDYIGWPSKSNEAATTINCGDGGGVYNSTVYCYTGTDGMWDKLVVYDENGKEI